MIYIFWQNVVSIHQSAFLKALAKKSRVILVAEEQLDKQRRGERWNIPSMGKVEIIVAPSEEEIISLIDSQDAYHTFSGINAFPMVYKAFKLTVKRGKRVSVFVEPYEWAGMKGRVRELMYRLLRIRFGNYVEHLFVTGIKGFECYRKVGFKENTIHQWGYFTEQTELSMVDTDGIEKERRPNVIYVGRLDENKNILSLLRQMDKFCSKIDKITIVGDGPLISDVTKLAESNHQIKVLGRIDNKLTKELMSQHDYLILPSLYDGWGAVVNEALSVGTRVLCSKACGASVLLDGVCRGEAFDQQNMMDVLERWLSKGVVSCDERIQIQVWAANYISGEKAADYFFRIINGEHLNAPWL